MWRGLPPFERAMGRLGVSITAVGFGIGAPWYACLHSCSDGDVTYTHALHARLHLSTQGTRQPTGVVNNTLPLDV